jgi:hypothetical protein
MAKTCHDCCGTGRDERKTAEVAKRDAEFRHRVKHHGSFVRCWACNGNGLDPAEYFRWGSHKPLAV